MKFIRENKMNVWLGILLLINLVLLFAFFRPGP
ncbi:hypothetical protein PaecuDRAFT_2834 [Paenibacillus curdlanolyticus YK9]|uniref:Uncharacterized protein n=1 Tax=Paenibacillus curdlanolyticus YK9 TaxID=717606 RepID=E0IAJ4_9BACL|nr:hypothetical protein PaecuDRAFT_2834 [Paenibacillus curdlanolyticus YK9]